MHGQSHFYLMLLAQSRHLASDSEKLVDGDFSISCKYLEDIIDKYTECTNTQTMTNLPQIKGRYSDQRNYVTDLRKESKSRYAYDSTKW